MFRKKAPQFEAFKNKTYLKCAIARIKQNQARKLNESKVMAKEIGGLLSAGKDEMARIKVEHLIRNKGESHALEVIELFCDLLLARHLLLESEPHLPVEMQESIFSICWAATRSGVDELSGAKQQLMLKYPEVAFQFGPARPEHKGQQPAQTTHVNAKLQEYLSVATPSRVKVVAYLQEIAAVHAPGWQPAPDMVDDPAPDLIQWQHIDRGQPEPQPQPQPAPSGDVTITFTEAELGLELVGVDHTGHEASSADAPTAYIMVSGAQPGSQAASAGVTNGHALKAVQGRPVIGLSFNQTVEAIRAAGRPVALVLGPAPMAVPTVPAVEVNLAAGQQVNIAAFPAVPGHAPSAPVAKVEPAPAPAPAPAFDDLEARFNALKKG